MTDEAPQPQGTPAPVLHAIQRVAADDALRPLLHWLFDQTALHARSGNDRREGMREIGLRLLELCDEANPNIWPALCQELAHREIQRRAAPPEPPAG